MTESEWAAIADRLGAAWSEPLLTHGRRAVYYDVLRDLSGADVRSACDYLLSEDRERVPPPGTIRQAALGLGLDGAQAGKTVEVSSPADKSRPAATEDRAESDLVTAMLGTGTTRKMPQGRLVPQFESQKATVSLIFGILSFVVVPVITSVIAVVFGLLAQRDIAQTPGLGGEQRATWGVTLGLFTGVVWVGVIVAVALVAG